MRILNIYNNRREIYIFWRTDEGTLKITHYKGFYPYFYEPDKTGTFRSYKNEPLKRWIVSEPADVSKKRSANAYEADILFCKRFLIDKVDKIEKCPIKVGFIDIEIQTPELPNVQDAKHPISCISVYNFMDKSIQTFFLPTYRSEYEMLEAFIAYLQKEKFDILTGWNFTKFDYPYLFNRTLAMFDMKGIKNTNLSEKISPINKCRYGDGEIFYPAGVSIIDYLIWFQKITLNREKVYTLDYVSQKYLNEPKKQKIDFTQLTNELKERNINDVKCLAKLEEKFNLIPYFDEIRRLTKAEWEDLYLNSRMIDMLLLEEAKLKKVVLPMKPAEERGTLEKESEFQGAYREIFASGRFENVYKADIASAYPFSIINFCLSPENITSTKSDNVITIADNNFIQNENALLPAITKKLINLKNEIKNELNTTSVDALNYKEIKQRYDAIKSLVNSAFGVMGNRFFRLYDPRVASSITFVVRSLLHYVKDKLNEIGCKVLYIDTDGIFYQANSDQIDYLNQMVKQWAKEVFNKDKVDITFESEGIYEKILLLALCRYYGLFRKSNGELEVEIKGIESKRKDSTAYIVKFQTTLINKILDNETKDNIYKWIKEEINNFKNQNIIDISFPCKVAKSPELYKNQPIFIRALKNTPEFQHKIGDSFYYIFMQGQDETKKEMVKALSEEQFEHINKENINWQKMLERNIIMKLDVIFKAMNWDITDIYTVPLTSKICSVCGKNKSLGRFPETGNICKVCQKQVENPKKTKKEDNFAGKVSKQTRLESIKESSVQVANPAPILIPKATIYNDLNLKQLEMKEISFQEAKQYIIQNHYSHRLAPGVKVALGFFYKSELVTAVVYSCPIGRLVTKMLHVNYDNCLELVRLFSKDGLPKNTESYCIGQSFVYLKNKYPQYKYLISYADPNYGHIGYIYQATNWKYLGLSSKDGHPIIIIDGKEVHSKSLYDKHGTQSIATLKRIYGNRMITKPKRQKHVYLMCLGNKKECKEWYSKFKFLPYPKAHNNQV